MIPDAVRQVVSRWKVEGTLPQREIAWPRQRWADKFPDFQQTIDAFPDKLSRAAVRDQCIEAGSSAEAAQRAFLAVMAWGFGNVGYGPYRTAKILADTPDAGTRLRQAAEVVADGGMLDGYASLADRHRNRLTGLGPAFGTKYLHFCSPEGRPPALILDRLVADWLVHNAAVSMNPIPWSLRTYQRYIDLMVGWAAELGIEPDQLEACLFTAQARRTRSQWS